MASPAFEFPAYSPKIHAGSTFELKERILGVLAVPDGGRRVEYISAGEIVTVFGRPRLDDIGVVDVIWKSRHLYVFLTDLEQRI